MVGRQEAPAQRFYDFSIDGHVPADHLQRRLDSFLDLAEMRAKLKPFYSAIRRPQSLPSR